MGHTRFCSDSVGMQHTYEVDTRYCTDKSYLRRHTRFWNSQKIIFLLNKKICRFDRRCVIVSSIDLCKKVIFDNFVTYDGLHGQRRYGTASVLDYGLDAAGESPTAVSVTWLWHWLYICSHGRWNVLRFAVHCTARLWWCYIWRYCPTLARHIPVEVSPKFCSTVHWCMLDNSWSFSE